MRLMEKCVRGVDNVGETDVGDDDLMMVMMAMMMMMVQM